MSISALWRLASIFQRMLFAYLNTHLAPLLGAASFSVGNKQSDRVSSILILTVARGFLTAIFVDEFLKMIKALRVLHFLGRHHCYSKECQDSSKRDFFHKIIVIRGTLLHFAT